MAILNYTTSIKPEKTISEIQQKLVSVGARKIMSDYDKDGNLVGLQFSIMVEELELFYKLPANIDGVHRAISRDKSIPKSYKSYEQAVRTSWRILKSWIDAQVAIIESGLSEPTEIFLPYMKVSNEETVFQAFRRNEFKAIGPGGNK